jgi:AcrR family transcriptional regulator
MSGVSTDAVADEADPLWVPGPPARRALSREAIVGAAVTLADAEGVAAVSMPRLARTLGAAPMSLYRHVPHKDALLALMVDAAVGPPPDLGTGSARDVRDGMLRWARANRAVFAAHPWTLPLVTGPVRMGPSECAWAEAFLALLDEAAGVPPEQAIGLLHVVNAYVRGASAPIVDRAPTAAAVRASGRADALPHLIGLLPPDDEARSTAEPGEELFEQGLAAVVDGCLGALRAREY